MRYSILAETYERLEATPKKLEKADVLAELYTKCKKEELALVVRLSQGYLGFDLGIARQMIKEVVKKAYGVSDSEVMHKFKETGDLGSVAEYFDKHRKQRSLAHKELSAEHVYETLRKLPSLSGGGSVERKIFSVAELLSNASPLEARYIVRTVLGELRMGVAAGIIRDAIAKAFSQDVKELERTFDFLGDYGKVAEQAASGKLKAEIEVGRPVRVMLADRSPGLREALEAFENPALELKYDGFRMAIHKEGNEIWLYSRRNENVTKQFPEIVELARKHLNARECIVEGEVLAVDADRKPLPFQRLSRRIQRKHDIEKMAKEIPVQMNFFDIIYLNGKNLMHEKLRTRWELLKKMVREVKGKFQLAEHLETKNLREAEKFYRYSLNQRQEGLIVKNLEAVYQPGKRVGYWLKVKPILEPLDLVVVGAEWGEGKRARWLGSLHLACKGNKEHGKFLETGKMGSGLSEEQMEVLTKKLRPLILEEHGKNVKLKPLVVVEIGYEEIQRSPKYPTGFALRFPRLLRIRDPEDKGPEDVNTLGDVERFFKIQKRASGKGKVQKAK
ncbi:MAG: ATP-dependent DNA ligase, DNA ligase 1 [archaeon GW2011_AR6]|nr:MAG: ATP-dependent DNA ligase, DNA ligase 1 [archaeon GW2011_AR6]HIH17391.1 ATP-dependent DNA ligase [Nanoarchaeota archaeon]HIH34717.1 ATP-dependent DNA ligase [Nanoarchaeota archaeon]